MDKVKMDNEKMESVNNSSQPFKVIENLDTLIHEIPDESIVSRTVWKSASVKASLFGFAAGQSLSDHTANQPAILQILEGEARITLGDASVEAKPGAWIYMPAKLVHSVTAHTPLKMLLLLLKD
jgi:quercetin dioxygenase-like cupin family protein